MDENQNKYCRNKDLVTRDIGGDTIIVPISGDVGDLNAVFTLNDVGSYIWNMLDGRTALADIIDGICAEYDVSPEQADKDLQEIVTSMKDAGLIHLTD
ncbi:MAG: PqqD family protein [Deltaproteobacteria bacterium]|nr:PqqD family protein [Deltaproteobacteria bacterium]